MGIIQNKEYGKQDFYNLLFDNKIIVVCYKTFVSRMADVLGYKDDPVKLDKFKRRSIISPREASAFSLEYLGEKI